MSSEATCPGLTIQCPSEDDTIRLGEYVGRLLASGDVLALYGDLGSGKTTFVKGLARALGIIDTITSPTFVIVAFYDARVPLHHIDLYRLNSPNEDQLRDIGLFEILAVTSICAIEWPEVIERWLPAARLNILFEHADTGRTATLSARGERFTRLIEELSDLARVSH